MSNLGEQLSKYLLILNEYQVYVTLHCCFRNEPKDCIPQIMRLILLGSNLLFYSMKQANNNRTPITKPKDHCLALSDFFSWTAIK